MKKFYEVPELKITLLEKTDVIVTSNEGGEDGELPVMP